MYCVWNSIHSHFSVATIFWFVCVCESWFVRVQSKYIYSTSKESWDWSIDREKKRRRIFMINVPNKRKENEWTRNGFVLYIFSLLTHLYSFRANKQIQREEKKTHNTEIETDRNELKRKKYTLHVWNIEEHFRKLYVRSLRIFSLLIWLYFAFLIWKAAAAAASTSNKRKEKREKKKNQKRWK